VSKIPLSGLWMAFCSLSNILKRAAVGRRLEWISAQHSQPPRFWPEALLEPGPVSLSFPKL
jgi:hypothetical protein